MLLYRACHECRYCNVLTENAVSDVCFHFRLFSTISSTLLFWWTEKKPQATAAADFAERLDITSETAPEVERESEGAKVSGMSTQKPPEFVGITTSLLQTCPRFSQCVVMTSWSKWSLANNLIFSEFLMLWPETCAKFHEGNCLLRVNWCNNDFGSFLSSPIIFA